MLRTTLRYRRVGALALLALAGLCIMGVRFARPAKAQPQDHLFLVSPPISVAGGDQIRSTVFNPTDSMLQIRFRLVNGISGASTDSPVLPLAPRRAQYHDVTAGAPWLGVVQIGINGAPANRSFPASLQVTTTAGQTYHIRYSTDDGATFPITN